MSGSAREPSYLVPLRPTELRLLVAALDVAEHDIRKTSPDEKAAYRACMLLRMRLKRRLDEVA